MAVCETCGKKIGFIERMAGSSLCNECAYISMSPENQAKVRSIGAEPPSVRIQQDQQREAAKKAIEAIMLTTETYPEGLKIVERIEVVTAECAFGMNIFKDLFAGVRDIVGGRSEAVQKTLRDSRRTALYELKKEAYEVGANAVVGVDLDYVELSSAGSMVLLVASGTAVKLDNS